MKAFSLAVCAVATIFPTALIKADGEMAGLRALSKLTVSGERALTDSGLAAVEAGGNESDIKLLESFLQVDIVDILIRLRDVKTPSGQHGTQKAELCVNGECLKVLNGQVIQNQLVY